MNQLLQKNGKNWRKVTLQDDGLLYESSIQGDLSVKKLAFGEIGEINEDYEFLTLQEYFFTVNTRRAILILTFMSAIVLFGVSGALSGPGDKMTIPATIAIALGWCFLVAGIVFFFFQSRRVRFKKIFFESGGYITLYARNQRDLDQIESFRTAFSQAFLGHLKKIFLRRLEENPTGLQGLLTYLHEKEQFSDKEYRSYLQKLKKAEKPPAKTKAKSKQSEA